MTAPTTTRRPPERPRATIGVRTILRQLRSRPTVPVVIGIVVLITGLVLTIAPRMFAALSEEALADAVARGSTVEANLAVSQNEWYAPGSEDDPFGRALGRSALFAEQSIQDPVRSMINETLLVVESLEFEMNPFPGDAPGPYQTYVSLRYMEGIEDQVRLVEGSLPEPQPPTEMWIGFECPAFELGDDPDMIDIDAVVDSNQDGHKTCFRKPVDTFAAAFSQSSLDWMGLEVGDRVVLEPGGPMFHPLHTNIDPDVGFFFNRVMVVSGVIEAIDPEDPYWYDEPGLITPSLEITADFVVVHSSGLINPGDYPRLDDSLGRSFWTFTDRHYLDHGQMTLETAPLVATEIRRLQTEFTTSSAGFQTRHSITSGLAAIIDDYLQQRQLAVAMLSMSAAGVVAVSVALVWLLATLKASNQRKSTFQVRGRGASRRQMTWSLLIEALVLTMPAAALAYGLATALIPGSSPLSLAAAVLVGVGATLFFVLASYPLVRDQLRSLEAPETGHRRPAGGRLVFEALVIALAVGAVVLVRRRPIEGASDLLLSVTPVLLAAAIALVTLRLYILPMRLGAWMGSRREGIVGFVGFQRVARHGPASRAPFLVVLVAVSVAMFAHLLETSIGQGQVRASYHLVGADYRVTGAGPGRAIPMALDLSGSAEATAFATFLPGARVRHPEVGARDFVDVLAIDADDYSRVTAGTTADPHFPAAFMTTPEGVSLGTADDPMPAIVSSNWSATRAPAPGQVFGIEEGRLRLTAVVTEVREEFPGIPEGRPFVVLPREHLDVIAPADVVVPTILYARATPEALADIESTVDESALGLTLSSQAQLLEQTRGAGLVVVVDQALTLVFFVSLLFAAMATVAGLLLMGPARERDLALLGTVGLDRRQHLAITLIEQVPATLVATLVGGLAGMGIAAWLGPIVDLGPFIGPGLTADVQIDPIPLLAICLGMVVIVVTAALLHDRRNRDTDLGQIVRMGER